MAGKPPTDRELLEQVAADVASLRAELDKWRPLLAMFAPANSRRPDAISVFQALREGRRNGRARA